MAAPANQRAILWRRVEVVIALVVIALFLYFVVFRRDKGAGECSNENHETIQSRAAVSRTQRTSATVLEEQSDEFDLTFSPPGNAKGWPDIEVQGSSGTYLVSLVRQTCTCPDFGVRKSRPLNTMGRLCKHLMRELCARGCFSEATHWHQAIANAGHGGPRLAFLVRRKSAPPVLLALSDNKEWINVYANTRRKGETIANASGSIEEFGWSVVRKGWSYGEGPPGARELRGMLSVVEGIR